MVEIKTKGMTCKSCEMLIIDALEDDDDVQNVTANFNISEDTLNLL